MNLDELRSVQSKERQKDSLQQLRESFYQDVASYITDLRAERDRRAERVDNPFSDDEVQRLSDELDTAEEVAEALYERRVGKVVKLASFAAADMSASEEGMTVEEQALFDDLVDRIKQNKASVLDVLAGGSDVSSPTDTAGSTPKTTGSTATERTESTPTDTAESTGQPNPTEASSTAAEPPTIGNATTEDAHPTPPEAETETDDVLATAMGGAADAESSADELPPAETPDSGSNANGTDTSTDRALDGTGTNTTDEDGVPTPDGGSTTHPPQSTDTQPTPNSVAGSDASQSNRAGSEPTTAATDSATTPDSEGTTTTPDTEPADTPESPPQTGSQAAETVSSPEPTGTESESAHQPTSETAAPAETDERTPATEPTATEAATQPSTQQDSDPTRESAADSTPRTMVRITDDVGTIFAVDEREYTLQPEDIVTLPTTNAEVLLQQDAATEIE